MTSNWQLDGLCREVSPELFFPVGNTGPWLLQIEEARSVCRRCPVMETCQQYALDGNYDGIWGGLSEAERRGIRRREARRRAATETAA